MRWVVQGLLVVVGGYMVFDGVRALVVGDYLTPASGAYAGELGPWSDLAAGLGIDPRSTPMKVAFLVIGTAHLLAGVAFVASPQPLTSWAVLLVAVSGLWYLPFGTLADGIVLAIIATTGAAPWH